MSKRGCVTVDNVRRFFYSYVTSMPNKHAAEKDLRKNIKHAVKNARMRMHTKSLMHQMIALLKEGKLDEAKKLAPKLQQAMDKAARAHVLHANKAARLTASAHRAIAKKK